MQHYLELSLLAGPEIPLHFLWRKVYRQLHLAFVTVKNEHHQIGIGVSFPEYQMKKRFMGSKLRIFSDEKRLLKRLDCGNQFSRLRDYLHLTEIREVPKFIDGYACFKRIQTKSCNARLARRKAKRHSMEFQEAMQEIEGRREIHSIAPFIQIESLSNQQQFPLFIQKFDKLRPQNGLFSTYGLSAASTVPEF